MSVDTKTAPRLRAFKFALDPTPGQAAALARHAGTARWAFNHALAAKGASHLAWREARDSHLEAGMDETAARKVATDEIGHTPSKAVIQKHLNQVKGDSRAGVDGLAPWWWEVNTYAFQSAFADADRAWSNWLDSLSGKRAGRRVGYPRFKKKGRSRESFRLHHDVKRPTIRPEGYRRLRIPRVGSVRLHDTAKRMIRLMEREDAVINSITITRSGHRWYASVLVSQPAPQVAQASRAQTRAGVVGVDLGVRHLATLSTGEQVPNPRYLTAARKRLVKAQRALSRTEKGSSRRARARARVARRHHEVAQRRSTALHALTKRLSTRWAVVAIEDLNVAGMTGSARGTIEQPGRNVRAKAGLNRAILDAAFATIRHQLDYKTAWYGSVVVLADRWAPTSKTCSACGWRNPSLSLAERSFTCHGCGLTMDRDHNAAINIAAAATDPAGWHRLVAPGTEETQNARGAPINHPTTGGMYEAMKREDPPGSPSGSNPRPVPPPAYVQVT